MINKYNDFILERLLNESVIFFAPPFKKVLSKLSNEPIAKILLDSEKTDIKPDITFINLDKDGYVSFTTMKNSKKILGDRFSDVFDEEDLENLLNNDTLIGDDIWSLHSNANVRSESPLRGLGLLGDADPYEKARNPIKLGRFINNIFPGKFNAREVEEFVNKFKSTLEQSGERFIEVSGEEIAEWYDYNNYKIMNGSLGSSCMARAEKRTFEIYTNNTEVCRMLVLLEDDKLIGRALIWKVIDVSLVSEDDHLNIEYFLDRQYTIKDSDVEKFRNYAVERGWAYKTYNNHHNLESVTFKDDTYKLEMKVQLKQGLTYYRFPYVDTFRRYDPKTGILTNDSDREDSENIGCYILDSTSGGYSEISDEVWSEWHDCNIERDDAVYSERLGDWIYSENSITIRRGSRAGVYPDGYDDICWSEWDDQYYHIDNATWCDDYQDYIFEEDAVSVVTNVDEDGNVSGGWGDEYYHKDDEDIILMGKVKNKEWYKKLKNRDWLDKEAIKLELLILDYKDEYVLENFKIETFLLKTDFEQDHFYLTEEDAELYGYEIDKVSGYRRITDWFDYYKDIETYKDKPTLFRDKPLITFDELKSKIEGVLEVDEDEDDNDYWTQRFEFIEKWYE